MIRDVVIKNRSYRRFCQKYKLSYDDMKDIVELAQLSPSSANLQPLKFIISCKEPSNSKIFQQLSWAGYLTNWQGPEEGERPSAYIIILGDTEIRPHFDIDAGIAAQSMLLGAAEVGLGGCIIGSVQRKKLRSEFNISDRYEILLVLAIGMPREKVVIETTGDDGSIKYWRDENGIHHVPKRSLDELIIKLY